MSPKRPRQIAPRLLSGLCRESIGHGLPPHIKRALKMIAAARNESLSWMLEKALIEHFGKPAPDYVSPRPTTSAEHQRDAEQHARARHKSDAERVTRH